MASSKSKKRYSVTYTITWRLCPITIDGEFTWDEAVEKMDNCFGEKDVGVVYFTDISTGKTSYPLEFSDLFEPRCLIWESGECRLCDKDCHGCTKRGYPTFAPKKNLKPSMFKMMSNID